MMKLSISDRVLIQMYLMPAFPVQGRLIQMTNCRSLLNELEFTQQEIKEYELMDNQDGSVTWNLEKDVERDFELNQGKREILISAVDRLDELAIVPIEMLPLIEKIYEL